MTGKRIAGVLFFLVFAAGGVAALLASSWWKQSQQAVGPGDPARVNVPKGAAIGTIAEDLEKRKLIRSAKAFTYIARGRSVQPGTYEVKPSETPSQILDRLAKGDILTVKVTIPEGYTLAQIARRLEENGLGDADAFLYLVQKEGAKLKASFPPPANLEGYLFPDTYRFPVGSDAETVAQRMLTQFDEQVAKKRADLLKKSGRTLREIVIIASMVEREARVAKDRAPIAGVIYNRLAQNMPLQIDATVLYAYLLQGEGHKERLLYRDLAINSPYNTYRVRGLPAGPICNPGIASLDAALTPDRSQPYLYYVARPDGSHIFGMTLAEHNRNIALVRSGAPVAAVGAPAAGPAGPAGVSPAPQRRPVRRRAPRRRAVRPAAPAAR
ncbi:MAG TPA: endolytic transglycosylase MltG [Armatimonadaceae bacterium]|nr:endolytic transglycosylase MltG [Armatimonadaceae bacterium]